MISNKPTILIYAYQPNDAILKEACAGMEEEGLLYEVVSMEHSDLSKLAFESANASILGTGIGIIEKSIELTIRSLPMGKCLYHLIDPSRLEARNLGANAARAVKRVPFKEL